MVGSPVEVQRRRDDDCEAVRWLVRSNWIQSCSAGAVSYIGRVQVVAEVNERDHDTHQQLPSQYGRVRGVVRVQPIRDDEREEARPSEGGVVAHQRSTAGRLAGTRYATVHPKDVSDTAGVQEVNDELQGRCRPRRRSCRGSAARPCGQ